ncbi:beta-ketoacyl synthase [Nocardia shimofusensis]|uniref:beta-ketoacyl synthase n=1 Tax=Nocardia shimofusensis TaxID=228596 RepID=UPI0009FFEDC0|nr:beta-ketoacyl synthase [Nocardia shimofusensis]
MTTLEFDGIAFDPETPGLPGEDTYGARVAQCEVTPRRQAPQPETVAQQAAVTRSAAAVRGEPVVPTTRTPNPLAEIRAGVVAAHRAALTAQLAMQRALWERAAGPGEHVRGRRPAPVPVTPVPVTSDAATSGVTTSGTAVSATAPVDHRSPASPRFEHAAEWAFKPLARTARTHLDHASLRQLTEGDAASVFGPAYRRPGVRPVARLAAHAPLALTEVDTLEVYGGDGRGRLLARFDGDPGAAATQAAEVFALYAGLPLCLSGGTLVTEGPGAQPARAGTLELIVTEIDLVPRPHLRAVVHGVAAAPVAVSVTVAEPHGAGVGPGQPDDALLLNEFHMAHLARGDQAVAMGPEFAEYTGVRATRLPTGGLLLVDRVLDFDGARGRLDSASYTTEYDSPADSWYYGATANESMPHFVYMETSLQAALLMGYYAGPTRTQPGTTLSLRNLGGTATVLRRVDLRDKTIRQNSRLLSTTILPGSSLQTFDYTLAVDGEPFYRGETMFGYFSDEALANQTGLDGGRPAPTWLAGHPGADVRVIDVAARRADPAAPLCARDTLALIDRVDVVDGGGAHGAGYLHSLRAIDPDDWYFARHFHLDPVIPGSLGVESVIHAVQEWMLDAGFADGLTDPVFRIPAGIAFSWRYRGQFLPTDGTVELEAHIKQIRRDRHGVIAVVDASLWKPGLRIYELTDLAVELGEREVQP